MAWPLTSDPLPPLPCCSGSASSCRQSLWFLNFPLITATDFSSSQIHFHNQQSTLFSVANLATYLLFREEILGTLGSWVYLSVYFSVEDVPLKWICDVINVQAPKPFSSFRWSLSSKHLLESLLLFKYVTCSVTERACLWPVNSKLPLGFENPSRGIGQGEHEGLLWEQSLESLIRR